MPKVNVAGLNIDAITKQNFLAESLERILDGQKFSVFTPYSEFLYYAFQNPALLDVFNSADFSLADGIGIFWAKKFLEIPLTAKGYWGKVWQAAWQIVYSLAAIVFNPSWIKSALPEKIVGADLVWDLAEMAAKNNLSVFLLGGFRDTPQLAADKISKTYFDGRQNMFSQNQTNFIAGVSNKNPDDVSLTDEINKANPDLLFVAYGPIKQEKWIAENLGKLNVKLAIGVGGTFDYIAGKRAVPPKFVRYSGLEWLWRLVTQPYRVGRIINATFGLMSGLWHYKVFNSLPLRPNVAVVIINSENKILVCQRNPNEHFVDIISNPATMSTGHYWQFPQGGVDRGEDLPTAAAREAFEETGLKNLQLIKISEEKNEYIWNNALRKFWRNTSKPNSGQSQHAVYFKFLGQHDEVKIDNREFIGYQWVDIAELANTIHPERAKLTKIVLKDLA